MKLDRCDDSGNPIMVMIGVEYQWKPKVCLGCQTFGHAQSNGHMQIHSRMKELVPQTLGSIKLDKGKTIVSTTVVVEEYNQIGNIVPSSQLASNSKESNGVKGKEVIEEQANPPSPSDKDKGN